MLPFASVATSCQTTLRWQPVCWKTYADFDVYIGFQVAMLSMSMAVDPDYGQFTLDFFD